MNSGTVLALMLASCSCQDVLKIATKNVPSLASILDGFLIPKCFQNGFEPEGQTLVLAARGHQQMCAKKVSLCFPGGLLVSLGPSFGRSWDHFGCFGPARTPKIESNANRGKNQQEFAANTQRIYRKPPRTCREPAEIPPRTSKKSLRTRRTNSKQKNYLPEGSP